MKRKYLHCALCVACFLCVFGSACNSDAPPTPADKKEKPAVGVLLYRDDDMYISLVGKALTQALTDRAEVFLRTSGNDQLTQDDQIDELLGKGVAALAVNLVDAKMAAHVVAKAKKADIPVVFFNREPDIDTIKSYGKTCFIGTNAFDAGKMQGDLIADIWKAHPEYDRNKDGKLQYLMFQGDPDNPEALARTEYSVRQAREKGVDMWQLGENRVCNWDDEIAQQAMRMAFATYGEQVELILSNNDSMALGVIRALQAFGYNRENGPQDKYIPVIGVDAIPQAVEAIQKKVMTATVKQDGAAMGQAVADLIMNAVGGKDFLAGTSYAWDNTGLGVRIPYSVYSKEK
ncbi:MAG: galactose ABC transporter substrate-binding protein [Desulfovibrio sp.]|jgi:methyl-galactoside transport system substrate-binding protein|nr:galactose ABC transporter substrate-binding protein [Desulfovibrio sp.]